MRKKLTILFALLCASMMGFAIDWNGYNWLDNGGVDGKYSNKIKATVSPSLGTAESIHNLQPNGGHASIHIVMPSAEFGAISLDAADYHTDGAGFFPHLDAFKKQETEFTVVCSGTTYTFTVYYEDGTEGGEPTPTPGPEPEPAGIDWSSVPYIAGQEQFKIYFTEENRPSNWEGINIQTAPWAQSNTGIYVSFPNGVSACSLGDRVGCWIEGAQVLMYLSAFSKQVTEVTINHASGTKTLYIYNKDGEPDDLTGWNIAKGKTSTAGFNAEAGHAGANDGNFNSRWSSNGGIHYPASGAQDWWYVDLGDFYRVDQIKILFEGAAPTDYDLLISNNAVSWKIIGTYSGTPKIGNNPETDYNVYKFTDKVGRYVKIFARNGYNNMQYGISIWEFEVYGKHASIDDHNPPSMTSASLSGTPSYNQVTIAVAGTDDEDGVVTQFHVVDASKSVDQVCIAVDGVIAVVGLEEKTSYSFTITALDAAGNESGNNKIVAATTPADPTMPTTTAPVPSGANKDILPVYCDAFTSILEHDFKKDGFAGVSLMMEQNISGDHCLVYNVAGANEITWGHYNGSNDEICAQSKYRGPGMGVDASAMEYLHIDIWSLQAGTNVININVNDAGLKSLRLSHSGNGWQGYDIAMSDFNFNPENPAYSSDNVRWMKFNGIGFISGKMALDNVYFWKTSTGLKSVSATPNNVEYGSASVVVKSTGSAPEGGTVVDGTEVTFSAIPKDGYVFVNWSNDETRATFDAEVNSNMNLTANFRALGNIYCNTEVTSTRDDDVHKAYATMKRTSANNYRLVVRSAETLGNFSNTTLQVNGSENLNLNNQGTLTDNNHMLTYEFTSTTPPSMTSGYMYLNVPGSKFTECWFTKLTNIEYEVPCEDENVPVESISLNYTETTIEIGNTKTLVVTFNPVYATDKTITWTSTNSSVASVDNGVVTANAIGTATITAATSNGKTATCAVTVEAVTEKTCWGVGNAFTYQGNPVSYYYAITRNVDKTLTYTAEFSRDVAGLGIQVNVHNDAVYSPMSYDSGSKTATFTTTEKFNTGNSLHGFFYFGGYRTDYYYTIGDECAKPSVAVTGVTINHTSATLMIDETVTLSAEVAPANADDKEIVWENSDPSVASFESSTGLVTALAVGTTTITAKSHADGSIFATCVVKVSSALTPTTWYGYGTFTPQEGLTGFTYSITRNSNRSLTYTIVLDKDPVGFVGELNIKDDGVYSAMTYTPATHTATFTTDENYALDGDVLNKSFWWLKYNGGVDRVNFSYTVGSENDPLPQAVAVDETKDNKAILTTYDGHTVIGVLGRSFTSGSLYTLVLPFDVDAAQTASQLPGQLTKLNNSYLKDNGDLRINFVDASAIEAGVPYLYQPSTNVTNPAFEDVTVSATLHHTVPADGYAEYHGIYAPMDGDALHALTNAYVLGSDQYLYAVSDLPDTQTMKALRAYFVLNFPSAAPGAPKRLAKVVFNENETETTTDIENLQTDNTCIKVIVNGQLQIIRDGKTYNAFGQLVK